MNSHSSLAHKIQSLLNFKQILGQSTFITNSIKTINNFQKLNYFNTNDKQNKFFTEQKN